MFDIKNVGCSNVIRNLQTVGIGVDFLDNLHGTDRLRFKLVVLVCGNAFLGEHGSYKVTDIKLHRTVLGIGRTLIRAGGGL